MRLILLSLICIVSTSCSHSILRRQLADDHANQVAECAKNLDTSPPRSRVFQDALLACLGHGVRLSEVRPKTVPNYRASFVPTDGPVESGVSTLPNGFLADLMETFEIIGFYDTAVAMANENSSPWTRYDEGEQTPLQDRWHAMKRADIANAPAIPGDTLLQKIHYVLSGDGEPYRDHPVVGGGDEMVDGPQVQGLYIVSAHQKETLEQNPYLTLTVRDAPASTDGTQNFYVKHEYPSANTYPRFAQLLSNGLKADLEQAKKSGLLADTTGAPFKALTRRIVGELIEDALSPSHEMGNTYRYQCLISIHPFGDYNGRSLRAWYLRAEGKPLFLTNWDWDLFSTPEEFAESVLIGWNELAWMRKSFLGELKQNPSFPHFYNSPGPWEVAAESDHSSDRADLAKRMRSLFQDGAIKEIVRHKSFKDLQDRIRSAASQP